MKTAPCEVFQPLYWNSDDSNVKGTKNDMSDSAQDDNRKAATEREQWFQQGVEAGMQEARRLSRQHFAPVVEEFCQGLEDLKNSQKTVTSEAAKNIIQLALSISEQILCASPELQPDDLNELREQLQSDIFKAYRLNWRMHPDDHNELDMLVRDQSAAWPIDHVLHIEADTGISRGELDIATAERQRSALVEMLTVRLKALLSH